MHISAPWMVAHRNNPTHTMIHWGRPNQGENYMGTLGDFAPEMQKWALEKKKKIPWKLP